MKDQTLVVCIFGSTLQSGLYSLPRDSHIPGKVGLVICALQLKSAFRSNRLIHTGPLLSSYKESTVPIA